MTEQDPRVDPAPFRAVPGLLSEGARLYNQGAFWDAHEAWESAWHRLRADGHDDDAAYVQGLILMTAAFENLRRGKPRGFRVQLEKAIARAEAGSQSAARLGVMGHGGLVHALERIHDALGPERDAPFTLDDLPEPPPALVIGPGAPTGH